MTDRATPHRRRTVALVAFVLVALGWVLTGSLVSAEDVQPVPHRAPVLLVGPDVVTSALLDEVDDLDGDPVVAGATEDPEVAAEALAEGEAVAVLTLDLRGTEDALALGPDRAPQRDRALVHLVRSVEATHGRSITVTDPPGDLRDLSPARAAYAAVLVGLLVAVLMSWSHGPFPRTLSGARRRLVVFAATGAVVGLVAAATLVRDLGDVGAMVTVAVVLGIASFAASLAALACEALAGRSGALVAIGGLAVLPLPLAVVGDALLLQQPWSGVARWTLAGGAGETLTVLTAYDGNGLLRPVVVVLGTLVLALGLLVSIRLTARQTAGEWSVSRAEGVEMPVRWQRHQALLAAGAIGGTIAIFAGWGLVVDNGRPEPLPSLASTTSCAATGTVRSVADLNRITRLRGSAAMRGGDVGASAALQDRRQIWLFGDTLRDAGVGGDRFVRNSMLLVEPGCLRVVVPESGGAVIPDRDEDVGYWPMSVAVSSHPGYDLVAVTAQRVHTVDPDDAFGFEAVGPAVATYVVPVGGTPQWVSTQDLGPDDPDTTRPMWGAATASAGRWLYLFGTSRPQQAALGTGFALHVARVPFASVADRRRWQYWDGTAWTSEPDRSAELIGAADGTSQTLSVFVRDGTWYAFSKRDEVLGQDLVVWTASSPTGPFTARPPVGSLPSDASAGELRYMPLAHPDLLPQEGSMVVSYSRNTTDVGKVVEDPTLYRPRFLRIRLP